MKPSASKPKPCEVCGKKAHISCPTCSTSYCTKKHEADDWKMHHNSCPSYKLVQEHGKPSYLVATRKIPKGTVIVESKPLVIGPYGSEPVCLGCLCPMIYDVMAMEVLCEGCKWPVCFGCQQLKNHQLECQAMQKAGFRFDEGALRGLWQDGAFKIFPGIWLLVVRILLSGYAPKLLKVYRKEDHDASDTSIDIKTAMGPFFSFQGGVTFVRETLKIQQFETKDIYRVTKVLIKSLHSLNPTLDSYGQSKIRSGSGVHVSDIVHLQHSCLPNTRLIETYGEPEIQKAIAVADIPAGAILCNYRYWSPVGYLCTRDRQRIMFPRKLCLCLRCTDPSELGLHLGSYPCKKCSGMMVPERPLELLQSNFVCEKCQYSLNYFQFFFQLDLKIAKEWSALEDGKDLGALVKFIEDNCGPKGYFHYNHSMILLAKDVYCTSIFNNVSEKGADYQFSSRVLQHYYRYTKDLMTVLSELGMDCGIEDSRSKLVRSRSIIHQWEKGDISRKKAEETLKTLLHEALEVVVHSSHVVDRAVQICYIGVVAEISGHCGRIHSQE